MEKTRQTLISAKERIKGALATALIFVLITATLVSGGVLLGGVFTVRAEGYFTPASQTIWIWHLDGTYTILENSDVTIRRPQGIHWMYTGHANAAARSVGMTGVTPMRDYLRIFWSSMHSNNPLRNTSYRTAYFAWITFSTPWGCQNYVIIHNSGWSTPLQTNFMVTSIRLRPEWTQTPNTGG